MKKILFIFALIAGVGFASCGDWLDVNKNPNSPSPGDIDATYEVMMPAIEMNIATGYGNFLRIAGGYHAQHYAHLNGTSNYLDYSRFQMSATRSSNNYSQLNTRALQNLATILKDAVIAEDWGSYLAATVLRAFTYQILVDCYGEIPYSEAQKGLDNLSPKYDDGKVVYEGVIAEIDAALEKVADDDLVCASFLFPSDTDATPWIQFANLLKLKMYMRMADVAGVDTQSKVAALIAENNFPTADLTWKGCWANQSGSYSPFYAEEFTSAWGSNQTNVAGNVAIIQTMRVTNVDGNVVYQDPRLPKFFSSTNTNPGSISGTQYPGVTELVDWCRPVASWDMPVYLISVAEKEFFLSEYYARWGSATDAAAHYAAAIEASFASAGVAGADAYVARYPYNNDNWQKSLGIAKWTALAGINTFEAWCEMRRLDYPTFGAATGDDFYTQGNDSSFNTSSYEPGTLYTPILVFGQVGSNKILERYPYPEASTSRNTNAPTFPGYTTPVFWAE